MTFFLNKKKELLGGWHNEIAADVYDLHKCAMSDHLVTLTTLLLLYINI
jgi:hypothetical protein